MQTRKAHDNRRSSNLLDNLNIEPAIQIRKNASIKTKGCPLRRDEVLLIKKLGYERCKQLKDMGRRWMDCRDCLSSLKEYQVRIYFLENSKHKR